jgi:hypothetical protein
VLFSTWISNTVYGFGVEPLLLFGIIRFCLVIVILIETLDEKNIYTGIITVVAINLALCILQLLYPESTINIFYNLYGKETHAVLERYYNAGSFGRPTGTLLSPVNVGVLAIISFSICIHRIKKYGKSIKSYIALILVVLMGLVSLTKTAWIGIPLLTMATLALGLTHVVPKTVSGITMKVQNIKYILLSAAMITIVVVSVYNIMISSDYKYQFLYYASFLYNPFEAFESRYSASGQLAETIDVTLRYPIFGLGATRAQGEFLGDSTLIRVAHDAGIVGLLVHVMIYGYLVYRAVVTNEMLKIVVIASLFLSGLALFTFYTKYGAVVLAYCLVSDKDVRKTASPQ